MPVTAKKIQRAMAEETLLCAAEGITDPAIIRERKLNARARKMKQERDADTVAHMEAVNASR